MPLHFFCQASVKEIPLRKYFYQAAHRQILDMPVGPPTELIFLTVFPVSLMGFQHTGICLGGFSNCLSINSQGKKDNYVGWEAIPCRFSINEILSLCQ